MQLFAILLTINIVSAYKLPFRKWSGRMAKTTHLEAIDKNELQEVIAEELRQFQQSRVAIELFGCMAEELVNLPHDQILTQLGVDDLITSLPYAIAQDEQLLAGIRNSTNRLKGESESLQNGEEIGSNTSCREAAVVVVTSLTTSSTTVVLIIINATTEDDSSFPTNKTSNSDSTVVVAPESVRTDRLEVIIVRRIVRYCAPPLLYQYLPHRLPHMIWHSVDFNQVLLQTQDILHVLVTGQHLI